MFSMLIRSSVAVFALPSLFADELMQPSVNLSKRMFAITQLECIENVFKKLNC